MSKLFTIHTEKTPHGYFGRVETSNGGVYMESFDTREQLDDWVRRRTKNPVPKGRKRKPRRRARSRR